MPKNRKAAAAEESTPVTRTSTRATVPDGAIQELEVRPIREWQIQSLSEKKQASSWYDTEKLQHLLERYAGGKNVEVLAAIDSSESLQAQLARVEAREKQHILPLNVSALTKELGQNTNHWVGLYITHNGVDALSGIKKVIVEYVDPMGHAINSDLKNYIEECLASLSLSAEIKEPLLGKPIQYAKQISEVELQGNTNDCGPMLVYIMACLSRSLGDNLPKFTNEVTSHSFGSFLREGFDGDRDFRHIYNSTVDRDHHDQDGPESKEPDISAGDTQSDALIASILATDGTPGYSGDRDMLTQSRTSLGMKSINSSKAAAAEEPNPVIKTSTRATVPGGSDTSARVGAVTQAEMQPSQTHPSLKARLKAIYRAQDTMPKLIEDPSIPEQRMDEYYVDLQMLVDNGSEKEPIESKDVFSEVGKHKAPSKVLIIGKAGVGKTTFLHHLSYEWGSDKAFADRFDYVFKVKLKKLLTEEARSVLLPLSGEDQLAMLVQMSLKDQQAELKARFRTMGEEELARSLERDHIDLAEKDAMLATVSSREIKEVLQEGKKGASQAGKVILLLDGYDEISHLDVNGNVVSEIMQTIYDYQVVLTSRPNAVTGDREREFDRMIESTGLNNDGALTYIDTYYAKKQAIVEDALDAFYEATPVAENKPANKVVSLMVAHFKKQKAENREIFKVLKQVINEQGEKEARDLKKDPISHEEVQHYVARHYAEVKGALERVLLSNESLHSVVTTPINTAMICLISDDPRVLAGFGEDMNAGSLYQEVIFWLAKRYTDKDIEAKARVKDLVKEGIFELPEVRVLKELACDEFKEGHVIIKGTDFESHARVHLGNGGIREVNKFGLMRPENAGGRITNSNGSMSSGGQDATSNMGDIDDLDLDAEIDLDLDLDDIDDVDSDDLVNRDHVFIHLSFQEYLTAHLLKEHLSSQDGAIHQDAAQLIAHHRSEPRYLMSLKFLAGLVSTDTVSAANEGSDQQELVALRFWDAVTCNVEGLLEFGLDTKVELFMHLLGQVSSRQMEQILSRPEHSALAEKFKLMQELIDVVVLSDFNKWSEVVIASNYISKNIAFVVRRIFEEQDSVAIVDKLAKMLVTEEIGDDDFVNPRLHRLIALALKEANDEDEGEGADADCLELSVRRKIQELLAVADELEQEEEGASVAAGVRVDIDESRDKHTQELKQAMEVVVHMTNKPEFGWQRDALSSSEGPIHVSTREIIFRKLIDQIKSHEQDGTGKHWQMQRVCFQKARQVMDKSISQEALLDAMNLVMEPRVQTVEAEDTRFFVLDPNLQAVSVELLAGILEIAFEYKQMETEVPYKVDSTTSARVEEIQLLPMHYLKLVGEVWAKDSDWVIKQVAGNALGTWLAVMKDSASHQDLKQAFDIIQELAHAENDPYGNAKISAGYALGEWLAIMKDFASHQDLKMAFDIIQSWAHSGYSDVRETAGNVLGKWFEVMQGSASSQDLKMAFDLIQSWAHHADDSWASKKAAENALGKWFEVMKGSASSQDLKQAFDIIHDLAHAENDRFGYAKQAAGNTLCKWFEVMKGSASSQELKQAFDIIHDLAHAGNDPFGYAKKAAENALGKWLEVMQGSASSQDLKRAFDLIQSWAHHADDSGAAKKAAENALGKWLEVMQGSASSEELKQAFDIIQSWAHDSDENVRQAVGNALGKWLEVMKGSASSEDLKMALDIIQEVAKDNSGYRSYKVRESAGNALGKWLEVMKGSASSQNLKLAFDIIRDLAKDNSGYRSYKVRESAGNALGKWFEVVQGSTSSQNLKLAFDIIRDLAKDNSGYGSDEVRESAVNALGKWFEVMQDSASSQNLKMAFDLIHDLAHATGEGSNYAKEAAGNALGKWFEVMQGPASSQDRRLALYIIQSVARAENDPFGFARQAAGNALGKWFEVMQGSASSQDRKLAFDLIQFWTHAENDEDGYAKEAAGNALGKWFEVMQGFASHQDLKMAFGIIQSLAHAKNDVFGKAKEAAGNAVKAIPLEFVVEFNLLHHSDAVIRNAAIESIPAKYAELEKEFSMESTVAADFVNSHLDLIKVTLSIVGYESKDDEEHVKAAAASAKKFLELMVNNATDEIQGWANDNFEDLLRERISSETPLFFKALMHVVLSNSAISDLDREFIIKSIQAGFTTSFTDDGKIIFEGRVYDLTGSRVSADSRSPEVIEGNKLALDAIIETAMSQLDLLSVQYRMHDPLFPTHEHSLTKPASDFVVARSLAGGARVVHSDKVIVTLVQPVSRDSGSVDSSQQFILLERRDAFGSLVLDKIAADGTVESVILHPDVMVHRPEAGNAALKKLILGLDAESKPADVLVKYQAATMVVSVDEGRKLLKAARKVQEDAGEVKESDASDVGHSKDSGDSFGALVAILKKSIGEEKVAEHELGKSWDHEVAVHQLIAMELSQEMLQIDSLGRRVDKLDAEFADSVFRDADILQHMIEDHKFAKAEKAEIASISANPYQDAFYKTLRMELNSSYLAATTIKSGWVQNNKKGDMGKFGSFMKEVSGVVPFVGPGVQIIGSVLKMADAKHQKSMIDNYATFVVDSAEMAQVAELIARMVVLSNLAIEEKAQSTKAKIKILLKSAVYKFSAGELNLLPKDLDEAVSMVQDKVIATVQSKISKAADVQTQAEEYLADKKEELIDAESDRLAGIKDPSEAAAKGKNDAKIVAQMIVGKIFAGKFEVGDLHAKAADISEFIGGEFGTMSDADIEALQANSLVDEDTATLAASEGESKEADKVVKTPTLRVIKGSSLDESVAVVPRVMSTTDEEMAKDIAEKSMNKLKLSLTKGDETLYSDNAKIEQDFTRELANALVSDHNDWIETARINLASRDKVIKEIANILEASCISSNDDGSFKLSTEFMDDEDFFDRVLTVVTPTSTMNLTENLESPDAQSTLPVNSVTEENTSSEIVGQILAPGGCCRLSYVTGITYDNEMLNHSELLQIAASKYGSDALSKLIDLGMDKEVAEEILDNIQTQGAYQVFDILFGGPSSDRVEESSDSANECVTRDITEKLIGSVVGNMADGFFASY